MSSTDKANDINNELEELGVIYLDTIDIFDNKLNLQ